MPRCNVQVTSTVWWKSGRVVKNVSPSQKRSGPSCTTKETKKHRTECVTANKCRCITCGRSSKHLKMQGTCEEPKWLREDSKHKLGRWGKSRLGGHDVVRRVDRSGEALIGSPQCSGHARQRQGPKLMNRYKPEKIYERMERCENEFQPPKKGGSLPKIHPPTQFGQMRSKKDGRIRFGQMRSRPSPSSPLPFPCISGRLESMGLRDPAQGREGGWSGRRLHTNQRAFELKGPLKAGLGLGFRVLGCGVQEFKGLQGF